jgi:hypothetical protein
MRSYTMPYLIAAKHIPTCHIHGYFDGFAWLGECEEKSARRYPTIRSTELCIKNHKLHEDFDKNEYQLICIEVAK